MKRLGIFVIGIGLIAFAVAIWFISREFNLLKRQQAETAEVVLQQMESVTKLVTAEGFFSEIYDYKDYYQWDIIPLRKKALMRVKAKVIMGYDLEKIDFSIDNETRKITITEPSAPEILALDHSVDYYDISEGTFNHFSEEDMNKLNESAKRFISEVAMKSNLVLLAEERKDEVIETLRKISEAAGYSFEITDAGTLPD